MTYYYSQVLKLWFVSLSVSRLKIIKVPKYCENTAQNENAVGMWRRSRRIGRRAKSPGSNSWVLGVKNTADLNSRTHKPLAPRFFAALLPLLHRTFYCSLTVQSLCCLNATPRFPNSSYNFKQPAQSSTWILPKIKIQQRCLAKYFLQKHQCGYPYVQGNEKDRQTILNLEKDAIAVNNNLCNFLRTSGQLREKNEWLDLKFCQIYKLNRV